MARMVDCENCHRTGRVDGQACPKCDGTAAYLVEQHEPASEAGWRDLIRIETPVLQVHVRVSESVTSSADLKVLASVSEALSGQQTWHDVTNSWMQSEQAGELLRQCPMCTRPLARAQTGGRLRCPCGYVYTSE